jgi:hypothetical protein
MENFNMNNSFYFVNKTDLFFPKLNFQKENIPVGNSISMCLALSWSLKERGFNYDIMKSVKGFPRCKESETGKFIWNKDDPVYGIDVPVWRQNSIDLDCSDENECNNYCDSSYGGMFVNGRNSKKCYTYDILDSICLVIEYDAITDDYKYSGGCFKDNMHFVMIPAKKDQVFYFEGIEIEVRNKKDPIIVAGNLSNFSFSFGERLVFIIYIIF